MLLALLAPALWNGFPLIFADTGGYVSRPFEQTLLLGRSALYGAFLATGMRLDFWLPIALQAAVTVWVVVLTLRIATPYVRPLLAALAIILLTIFTGLPWYASQLMPDIFVFVAVLALYLLAFARDRLRRYEVGGLAALIALAIAFHMSILALVVALTAAFAFATLLRFPRPRLLLPTLAVVAGLLLGPLSNLAITGRLAFTPGGTHFAFARLVQDGIIARYVKDHCPGAELAICAYAHELPSNADGWLWGWDAPFYKLGGWEGYESEARRIVGETLLLYPGQHLTTAITAAAEQLVMFRTGEGINARDLHHALPVLKKLAPDAMPRLRASAQLQDLYDFDWINRVHVSVTVLALIVLLAALFPRFGVPPAVRALAATVLLALGINAAVCGVISNPNDRYQGRIVPLAPLAAAIVLLARRRSPQSNLAGATRLPA